MKCKLDCQSNLKVRMETGNITNEWKDIKCPVCGRMSCVYIGIPTIYENQ